MPQVHPIHSGDTAYATPVLRHHSSASSLGTVYGEDETSFEDNELSPEAFERKIEEAIRLHLPTAEEERACQSVLLPRPKGPEQEKALHEHVMRDLRARVQKLEDDALFEARLLRGSLAGYTPVPTYSDIDALMHSMTVEPEPNPTTYGQPSQRTVAMGPWNVSATSTTGTFTGVHQGRGPGAAPWGDSKGKGRAH